FEAALTQGSGLTTDEAIAQACKARGPRGRPASGWSSLTNAERQVAELVAEGLTNREIAERLFVTPGTVKNHASHTFSKLGIHGRVALAREVRRQERCAKPD
ncbi:MAG: LuxR C-terminal-related transcriptional regulator, partial [Actinomycetota bacterium]|nr:LuxR C-terminal-related transcriptional regulator [Actinomycetota bacterium]